MEYTNGFTTHDTNEFILIVLNDSDVYPHFLNWETAAQLYTVGHQFSHLSLDNLDFVFINEYLRAKLVELENEADMECNQ